jgi:subtilisin family serine protease
MLDKTGRYVEGELLVKFKKEVPESSQETAISLFEARKLKRFRRTDIHHLGLPAHVTVEEAVGMFMANPNVEHAEPNYMLRIKATPSDTFYDLLWGLNNIGQSVNGSAGISDSDIDAPEAWDTETGSNSVVIAIVDTGIDYNHPDVSSNIWVNTGESPDNGLDDDGNGHVDDVYGWDFLNDENDPMDDNGHGTHLAGIMAGGGNNGAGVTGVNWTARVMALKFLDAEGFGDVARAISAIEYATQQGVDIINCSFGTTAFSQFLKDAVDASSALLVCAAGNESLNSDLFPHYPSGFDSSNMLAVAASNQADNLASFSNFGASSVDVAAPGTNILSTVPAPRSEDFMDDFNDNDISDWTTNSADSWVAENGTLSDGAGNYGGNINEWARRELPLSGKLGCSLAYTLTLDTESGGDFLYVESSTDLGSWTILLTHTGSLTNSNNLVSLPTSGSGPLYVRFRLVSDSDGSTGDGAQIDSLTANCATANYDGSTEYSFIDGSSMSAAVASGVAGLIKAANPSFTAVEIKDLIISSADEAPSFRGLVLSNGRINAGNAFIPAPSGLSAQSASSSSIDIAWTDNSTNESGFSVERKTSSTDFSETAQVGSNVASFSDTGLGSNTTYTYRVRAFTDTGASPYSGESSAQTQGGSGDDGGCFIATAAYGDYSAEEVKTLREFRDRRLLANPVGKRLVRLYYKYSPPLADYISGHPGARRAARLALAPVVFGARHPAAGALIAMLPLAMGVLALSRSRRNRNRKGKEN